MEEKKRKTLKSMYATACNNYLEAFAEKHGFDIADCDWTANEPGGIASIGDYFVDMATIITDIDRDAPVDEWIRWYDYSMDCADLGLPDCNFRSWLMGCPRHNEESYERLRTLRNNVQDAETLLHQAIEEEKNRLF